MLQKHKQNLIDKLKLYFSEPLRRVLTPHGAAPLVEHVAAVKDHIEELALQQRLAAEDAAMCKRYDNLFPDDIPHVDRLPTNVYHRIHLKDPSMTIARRQYKCPKHYREV